MKMREGGRERDELAPKTRVTKDEKNQTSKQSNHSLQGCGLQISSLMARCKIARYLVISVR